MNGFVKYFWHDGGTYVIPHNALLREIPGMINECREAAVEAIKQAGAAHAVYAVKKYAPETGALAEVDFYAPAVLLDDAEFYKRTGAEAKENPGCIILASHAKQ